MRVIVVHGDLIDLLQQPLVDFLDVGAGQWLAPAPRSRCRRQRTQ